MHVAIGVTLEHGLPALRLGLAGVFGGVLMRRSRRGFSVVVGLVG